MIGIIAFCLMQRMRVLSLGVMMPAIIGGSALAGEKQNAIIDFSKAAVVMPFESSLTKAPASLLPETTKKYVIAYLKEAALFSAVLTPEEAKDKDKATLIEITGKLGVFASGNTAARLIPYWAIFSGSGAAHTEFDIAIKDSATGKVLWKQRIRKEDASYSLATTSLRSRLLEPPEKIAMELVKQLKAEKNPEEYPLFHIYPFAGEMLNSSRRTSFQMGIGGEIRMNKRFSLNGEAAMLTNESKDSASGDVRLSINPSYHFARRFNNKLDPFLAGGLSWRLDFGNSAPNWAVQRSDTMIDFGGGINYWASPRYGLKLELLDHVWPTKGTTIHYMDMRVGICFGFL